MKSPVLKSIPLQDDFSTFSACNLNVSKIISEYYHVFQCAIDATRDAYMPNAQRKKEYLRIYEDVVQQNEILVSYLAKRQNATLTSNLLNATSDRTLDKGSVIREAMSRWNESRLAVRGSQSGGSSGGDGEESVNR